MSLSAPQALAASHKLDDFDCGKPVLNQWLQRRVLANHIAGASRTFVIADAQARVQGYYALAAGAVMHEAATGSVRRNMPDPVPVMVLARLALDKRMHGQGIGPALLRDAVLRSIAVSEQAGVRALLAHALDEDARDFYLHFGFNVSPLQPMTVMLVLPRSGI